VRVCVQRAGALTNARACRYVTSCPTNLGTGCRASVLVKLPNLTADGTDAKAKAICKPLGLSVRGMGGEHTPIGGSDAVSILEFVRWLTWLAQTGADGTVDISPSARLQITEAQIIVALYKGMSQLLEAEKKAAGSKL
jgi:protein-arginine kinase